MPEERMWPTWQLLSPHSATLFSWHFSIQHFFFLFALRQDLQVCIPQTLPVNDPLHKACPWQDLRNVDSSGNVPVPLGFNFITLSDAKLSSVLLQLGTMPECERHLILCIKCIYPSLLISTFLIINVHPFTIFTALNQWAATLHFSAFLHFHLETSHPCGVCFGSDENQD